jgi:hypothetical protein
MRHLSTKRGCSCRIANNGFVFAEKIARTPKHLDLQVSLCEVKINKLNPELIHTSLTKKRMQTKV